MKRLGAAVMIAFSAVLASQQLVLSRTPDIIAQTRYFLDAYARGDPATVLRLIDDKTVRVYGSDAAEIFKGARGVQSMLESDHRLWGGPSRIGHMENVSVFERDGFASIFFDAPFSAKGRPSVLVRFAMVWRCANGSCLLVQSSNVVPTQSRGAALSAR